MAVYTENDFNISTIVFFGAVGSQMLVPTSDLSFFFRCRKWWPFGKEVSFSLIRVFDIKQSSAESLVHRWKASVCCHRENLWGSISFCFVGPHNGIVFRKDTTLWRLGWRSGLNDSCSCTFLKVEQSEISRKFLELSGLFTFTCKRYCRRKEHQVLVRISGRGHSLFSLVSAVRNCAKNAFSDQAALKGFYKREWTYKWAKCKLYLTKMNMGEMSAAKRNENVTNLNDRFYRN